MRTEYLERDEHGVPVTELARNTLDGVSTEYLGWGENGVAGCGEHGVPWSHLDPATLCVVAGYHCYHLVWMAASKTKSLATCEGVSTENFQNVIFP